MRHVPVSLKIGEDSPKGNSTLPGRGWGERFPTNLDQVGPPFLSRLSWGRGGSHYHQAPDPSTQEEGALLLAACPGASEIPCEILPSLVLGTWPVIKRWTPKDDPFTPVLDPPLDMPDLTDIFINCTIEMHG